MLKKILTTLFIFCFFISAYSQQNYYTYRICLPDWPIKCPPVCIDLPEIDPNTGPVGCEVIDCCPGCPGPGPFDYRIEVEFDKNLISSVDFVGTPNNQLIQKTKLVNGAKTNDVIKLKNKGQITNLSSSELSLLKSNLFTNLKPNFKPKGINKKYKNAKIGNNNIVGKTNIKVKHYYHNTLVRVSDYKFVFEWCNRPKPQIVDKIKYRNNTADDNVVAIIDYRNQAGCIGDEIRSSSNNEIVMPNVLANQSDCNSEIISFSIDNAISIKQNPNWTDNVGDLVLDTLQPMIEVPMTIWVLSSPFNEVERRVLADVNRANVVYNQNSMCGITFVADIRDATNDPQTPSLINSSCSGNINNFSNDIGFVQNTLNIYYVGNLVDDDGITLRGQACNLGINSLITLNSTIINNEALAHEIGHTFSLSRGLLGSCHTDDDDCFDLNNDGSTEDEFPSTNIMTRNQTRNEFTLGQCLRCVLDDNSFINLNNLRQGVVRNCPDNTNFGDTCPPSTINNR